MCRMHVKQSGFTLLEMMVVIVILGLLASLTIPSLMSNKDKADHQKVVSDITTLENALDMYKLDNGSYPTTEQGISALELKPTQSPLPRNYRDGGYIRRLSKDPWGNSYQLKNPGDYAHLDIYSIGPDGKSGTNDDIGNWVDVEPELE